MALTLSMLMWLVAFLIRWGGMVSDVAVAYVERQEAAFRMFAVVGVVLLILMQPDTDTQP